jgi:hypothetical protein
MNSISFRAEPGPAGAVAGNGLERRAAQAIRITLTHSKDELEALRRAQEKAGSTLEAVAGF